MGVLGRGGFPPAPAAGGAWPFFNPLQYAWYYDDFNKSDIQRPYWSVRNVGGAWALIETTGVFGMGRIQTQATTGNGVDFSWGASAATARQVGMGLNPVFHTAFYLSDAIQQTIRIGLIRPSGGVGVQPQSGTYFENNPGAVAENWQCITRQGGVETKTNSGIAVTTGLPNWQYFYFIVYSGVRVEFYAGNTPGTVALVATHTTNLTTDACNPMICIYTKADDDKQINMEYVWGYHDRV